MSGYLGAPGGPRDPATPGGYCLAVCRCGTCPQHAEAAQAHADWLNTPRPASQRTHQDALFETKEGTA